jgi:AcrR family transcriptional regulator
MPRAAPQRDDRRGRISRALYHCISEKGYANTSLKDIALRAGMSPSHIGYYFDNKAAILEYYAAAICHQNLAALPDPREPDLERRIDALADFCLGPGQMNTALLGVIQELTGLAVHDARLHEIKAHHARAWREHLESFFDGVTLVPGLSAKEAARITHAILVGLNTNTLFDSGVSRTRAHQLFRRSLRGLVGVHEHGSRRTARVASTRRSLLSRSSQPSRSRKRTRKEPH